MASKGYDILINDINKLLRNDRVMIAATNTVLAAQKKRIFQQGKASNEQRIGVYSTNPISISRKSQSRNTGKTYFKGGYKQYKAMAGKNSNFVNLDNTGQMKLDLSTFVLGKNEYGIGFNNDFNADKRDWMEKKYGKDIFVTTSSEDNLFEKVLDFELSKI